MQGQARHQGRRILAPWPACLLAECLALRSCMCAGMHSCMHAQGRGRGGRGRGRGDWPTHARLHGALRPAPCALAAALPHRKLAPSVHTGARLQAGLGCAGLGWHAHLVHTACGMISPKKSTAVTESMMAVTGSAKRSRNKGNASMLPALHISSVTSRKWLFLMTGMILRAARCSCGVPLRRRISMSTMSNDMSCSTQTGTQVVMNTWPQPAVGGKAPSGHVNQEEELHRRRGIFPLPPQLRSS